MYRLLAIDLDDTLLADDLSISEENQRALDAAKQRGVAVVACSGRESASMRKILDRLDFPEEGDYFISYNGAIVQTIAGEILRRDCLEGEFFHQLVELGRKQGVLIQCYCDSLVTEETSERLQKYEIATGIQATRVEDLKTLPYSIKMLFNSGDRSRLEAIKAELEETAAEKCHCFFSKPNYLEVLGKDSNKGIGVKFLAKHLGIAREDVICIGDSFNDAYMLEYAGLGVAMCNAHSEIRALADVVTERDNNHSGVAEVIEKYILKERETDETKE